MRLIRVQLQCRMGKQAELMRLMRANDVSAVRKLLRQHNTTRSSTIASKSFSVDLKQTVMMSCSLPAASLVDEKSRQGRKLRFSERQCEFPDREDISAARNFTFATNTPFTRCRANIELARRAMVISMLIWRAIGL